MKNYIKALLVILFFPLAANAQEEKGYPELNYEKQEIEIKMRDGKTHQLNFQRYTPEVQSGEECFAQDNTIKTGGTP